MKTLEIRKDNIKIYDIYLDDSYSHLAEKMSEIGVEGRKVCIVTDSNVAPLYLMSVENICCKIASKVIHFVFEAGELHKNLNVIEKIYEKLIIEKFDRNDYLIALGGGVVGDMTGYAAATYLRGIKFIQLPTTLLSQVDSSIGGKTGVDFKNYKNMIGAFHQPSLVYMNLNTLNSLDDRELSAGMAEVIKHGLIKDCNYFTWLIDNVNNILNRDYNTLESMIYKSCMIKGEVVEKDPKEQGERALLNFGHTVGHSVEKIRNFEWLHGECVAVGSIVSAAVSKNLGWITKDDYEKIKFSFELFKLPSHIGNINLYEILDATKSDKKMDGGKIRFILLRNIGDAIIYKDLTDEDILNGIGECL